MTPEVLNALQRNLLFATMPAASMASILEQAAVVRLAAGDVLYRPGEAADRFIIVVSGQLELFIDSPHQRGGGGGDAGRLCVGDSVGEEAVLDRGVHATGARATEAATVVVIRGEVLFGYLEDRFDLVLAMLAGFSARLRAQVREITELKLKSTAERLAGFLLTLTDVTEGSAVVRLPFDKYLLAEKLGMQPESLSRAFAKLRAVGVRTEGHDRRVVITELAGLRRFCQDGALH